MLRLYRFCLGIAECEGYIPPSGKLYPVGSRSWRNNNPGNLRSSIFEWKNVENFSVFASEMDGWQALLYDVRMKALGKSRTGLTGESTIKEFVKVWAPDTDGNAPDLYVRNLCKFTGFVPSMKLKDLLL